MLKRMTMLGVFFSFVLCSVVFADLEQINLSSSETQEAVKQYVNLYTGGPSSSGGGLSLSSIIAAILFGAVGFIAFAYGKKMSSWKPMAIGILLMVYPYFVSNTMATYLIGLGLCAALYFFRD